MRRPARTYLRAALTVAAGLILMLAAPRPAQARRLAVVVGNNAGTGDRPALRFAENDAERMARLLLDVGGVAANDLRLLRGQSIEAVRSALADVRTRALKEKERSPVVVLFYFSGHSDGISLELGDDPLPFAEVRAWLETTGASVRLAILDSCRSGGLLALKGGALGPIFDVRLADSLASTGEALISSSAASESAVELSEIGASVFSHHLISGLRGAADVSGDGLVTLAEAYQYAFARTVRATANTIVGPQHPVYDYRLSGRGDLVLTQIRNPSAVLRLPGGFERILVVDGGRQEIVAEIGGGSARRLATPPGVYEVRAWQGGRLLAGRVTVEPNQERVVTEGELAEATALAPISKGAAVPSAWAGRRAFVGLGVTGASSDGRDPLPLGRLGVAWRRGWVGALVGGSWHRRGFRESQLQLRGGRHRAWGAGGNHLWLSAGLELGAGLVVQSTDSRRRPWTSTATAAALVSVGWAVRPGLTLVLTGDLPVTLLRFDRHVSARVLPAALMGVWF